MRVINKVILLAFSFVVCHGVAIATKTDEISSRYIQSIDTNFLTLEARAWHVAENPVVLAIKNDAEIWYSDRNSNTITQANVNGDLLVKKRSISIPLVTENNIQSTPLILDLHFGKDDLYISMVHFFADPKKCSKAIVYEIKGASLREKAPFIRPIFESRPCVGGVGAWSEIAGRIASNDEYVFLSGGNVLLDLYENRYPRPGLCCLNVSYEDALKSTNLFGSIISISKSTYKTSKISEGHRGPQGLAYDASRRILLSTEHGPRGGDEINLIVEGKHYGWPYVSLGRSYMTEHIKNPNILNPNYDNHSGYEEPVFAWVPSIGISQVAVLPKSSQLWPGDVLVSSLKDAALWRLKWTGRNTVLYAERILIGERIRDLEVSENALFMSTDRGQIIKAVRSTSTPEGVYPPLPK